MSSSLLQTATENRLADLNYFVKNCFSESDSFESMQGDAGLRKYFRLLVGGKSYIVMDCPPSYASVEPFIYIAEHLQQINARAPKIIHSDVLKGFLILEDFGNISVKDYLNGCISQEEIKEIYSKIMDLLVFIQAKKAPESLVNYDIELLKSELDLFTDWYIPYKIDRSLTQDEFEDFRVIWEKALSSLVSLSKTIVLRDYHAENMMYLSGKEGINNLGLLDFQDALLGCPVYDVVSMLEDARIEVPRALALEMLGYFAEKKGLAYEDILLNYHILGAQRNSRILGVFARKFKRDNDNRYLQYIPLVLKYLEYDLSCYPFEGLRIWMSKLK